MAAFVLDTDTLTLFQRRHAAVCRRVYAHAVAGVAVSAVTVEEQLLGWLTVVRAARTPVDQVRASQLLPKLVESWAAFPILPTTATALPILDRLARSRLNVGGYDLRIAAAALDIGAAVVTRNRRDFGRVPGLVVVDWSA
jgi:tRNA(fMet)-specific endonuclease VapC